MAEFEDRLAKTSGLVWFIEPLPPSLPPTPRPPVWGGIPTPYPRPSFLEGGWVDLGAGTVDGGYSPSPPSNVPPGGSGPVDWHKLVQYGPVIILSETLTDMAKNGVSSIQV